jgi:hypothetical protein
MKEIKINENEFESKTNTKNITNKVKNTTTINIESNNKNIIKKTIKIENIQNLRIRSLYNQSHPYLLGPKLLNKIILKIL